ncbi:MAG: S8 family serine peptidase, partial [Aquificaceae bacterium]|nr:S8 family serine peptidase [Aquificaceae bacterium]
MKLLLFLALAFSSIGGGYLPLPEYVEGEVLVKVRAGVSKTRVGGVHAKIGAQVVKSMSLKDGEVQRVKLPKGVSVTEAINYYLSDPAVEYAEPNYIVRKAEIIPNDTSFNLQWGLRNVGQMVGGLPGVSGVDVGASYAWQTCTGGSTVVAVLDTGVDYNHPDLSGNIWRNTGETSCDNGVDEDSNGYVDDCFGWNFVSNNNNPMDDDSDGHGTHVAGVIGAVGNNSIGVSGVNWSVKIMPVKFLDAQGNGTIEQAVRAIKYAVDMGAKVINASYAYPSGCFSVSPSVTERNILEYARSRGVIVVSASGNYGCNNDNTPFYPASHRLDNVLSVSASNSMGGLPSWSNYGLRSVHLAAPGVKIYSALPSNQYGFLSGTSMASPFVSGAVAMLFS